LDQG